MLFIAQEWSQEQQHAAAGSVCMLDSYQKTHFPQFNLLLLELLLLLLLGNRFLLPTRPDPNLFYRKSFRKLSCRKPEILDDLFLGFFRLKCHEEILLEQENVSLGCKKHPEPVFF